MGNRNLPVVKAQERGCFHVIVVVVNVKLRPLPSSDSPWTSER